MAETSAYFTAITDERSIRQFTDDEEGSLDGTQLLSIESDASTQEQDFFVYVHENFATFLKLTEKLRPRDRELLLCYYIVRKTQNQLGRMFGSTQTVCSFNVRLAVKALACLILFGGNPTQDQSRTVLEAAGFEEWKLGGSGFRGGETVTVSLSQLVDEYATSRSFAKVAAAHEIHRPEVRRTLRRVADVLLESDRPDRQAIGAWIHSLVDKASPTGTGKSKKSMLRDGNITRSDPPELGYFRVKIDEDSDDLLDQIFAPRGNQ